MLTRLRNINFAIVARFIGWLVIIEGIFMLAPLLTALAWNEPDVRAFLWPAAGCLTIGPLMAFGIRPRSLEMGTREGFLLTAMVWVAFSTFGMIPFLLIDNPLTVSEAFFEAMSGFTTTGASVIESVEGLSHGILLWRSEMNWIGGMGIILFTLAVLPMLNHSGGIQLFNAEVTGITHDKIRPRISQTAKDLWSVYLILTIVLIALLWAGPMDLFDAVCQAFSTVSTGGFSTRDDSIAAWDSTYVDIVITVFMFLGSINFTLIFMATRGRFDALLRNDVFLTFIKMIGFYYLLFVVCIIAEGEYTGVKSVTIDPLFQIMSCMSSTGMSVFNFERWGTFVLSMMFLMMFFGSCAGSTAGGAKIDRFLFLIKNLRNEIYRCVHPNSVTSVRINGKVMSNSVVQKVVAFLCLYVLIIAVGGTVLTACGLPLIDSYFAVFSCVGNTGFGAGVTGYGGGWDLVPPFGQWVLSLIMLTGRLEIFTVLILFTKGFWRK